MHAYCKGVVTNVSTCRSRSDYECIFCQRHSRQNKSCAIVCACFTSSTELVHVRWMLRHYATCLDVCASSCRLFVAPVEALMLSQSFFYESFAVRPETSDGAGASAYADWHAVLPGRRCAYTWHESSSREKVFRQNADELTANRGILRENLEPFNYKDRWQSPIREGRIRSPRETKFSTICREGFGPQVLEPLAGVLRDPRFACDFDCTSAQVPSRCVHSSMLFQSQDAWYLSLPIFTDQPVISALIDSCHSYFLRLICARGPRHYEDFDAAATILDTRLSCFRMLLSSQNLLHICVSIHTWAECFFI